MSNRQIERAIARTLYNGFSRAWRREKRLAGKYGEPGFKKPTFNQWNAMHERNSKMMAESTPADVQEFLGLDPWSEPPQRTPEQVHAEGTAAEPVEECGVLTIPISGDE